MGLRKPKRPPRPSPAKAPRKAKPRPPAPAKPPFQAAFDRAPMGMCLVSPAGRFLRANDAFCRMLGYSDRELQARTFGDVTHPEDLDASRRWVRQLLSGEATTPDMEKRYLHKAGHVVWGRVRASLLRNPDGSPRLFVAHILDVTGHKRAEETLRALSRRHDAILTAVPDIIMEVDCNKVYTWANRAGLEFFGEDVVGKEAAFYFEGEQDTYRTVQPLFKGDERVFYVESWQRRRDGQKRLLAWWCRALVDGQGTVTGALSTARDITEPNRAEAAAARTAREWQATFDATNDAIWILDRDQRVLQSNRAAERLFQRPGREMIGRPCWEVVHGGTGPVADCPFVRAQKSLRRETMELRVGERWLEVTVDPLLDAAGRLAGAVHIVSDITERKRVEDALRESEERYRALFVNSRDALMTLEPPSWAFTSGNPATVAMFRAKDEADFVSHGPWDLSPERQPDGRPSVEKSREMIGTAMRDGSHFFEWTHRRIGGEAFPATVLLTRMELAGKRFLQATVRDITDRKQAEVARFEALSRFFGFAEASQYGMGMADMDGRILYVNATLVRMLGERSADDSLGKHFPTAYYPPLMARKLQEEVMPALRRDGHWHGELELLTVDGRHVPTDENFFVIRDEQGQPRYIADILTDISERKRAEAERARLEDQLRQAQKMEAIGNLAGGVAHDFNNMLTVIQGYAETLQRTIKEDDPHRKPVEEIRLAAKRAAGLTRQLLAFSRRQILEPRVLDLGGVVRNVEPMLRRLIGEDIDLRFALPEGLGRVKADSGQIEQILMNLAVNARDAMAGGGRLTIEAANVTLDTDQASRRPELKPGPHVMLAVTDTGTGMPPEVQRRLFEPFFTTKEQGKGTGLGLATVYGIVKQSGGHIAVDSEFGRGATFTIHLPRVEEPAGPVSRARLPAVPARGTETILVAEDEEGVRELVRAFLQENGYTVLVAADGFRALEAVERHAGPLHLLVSDVVMPQMGGKQLAERLRSIRPGIRILFTSGYTDDAIAHQGVLDPGIAFIHKPYELDSFLAKVREVLDGPAPARP